MPEFRLVSKVTVSAVTTVQAATLAEAIEQSKGRPVENGHYGPYSRRDHWLVFDLDGMPYDIEQDDE